MPINPIQQKSGSPLLGLMQMYQTVSGMGGPDKSDGVLKGRDGSGDEAALPQAPDALPQAPVASSAIDRRAQAAAQSPEALIAQGFNHANDPKVPLDYETRLAVAEPLLRAKHFGIGGGQGQVSDGKIGGGKGIGSIVGAIAALA